MQSLIRTPRSRSIPGARYPLNFEDRFPPLPVGTLSEETLSAIQQGDSSRQWVKHPDDGVASRITFVPTLILVHHDGESAGAARRKAGVISEASTS